MNVERLTRLAEVLDQLKKNPVHGLGFDINNWVDNDLIYDEDLIKTKKIKVDGNGKVDMQSIKKTAEAQIIECGYSACAVGHACLMPEFQKQGLHFSPHETSYIPAFHDAETGQMFTNMKAVSKFFDITEMEGEKLFIGGNYKDEDDVTAAQVAKKIRKFIKKKIDKRLRG